MKLGFVLATGLIAALIIGGRFAVSGGGNATAYVVDRFTGHMWFCHSGGCRPLDFSN